MNRKGKPFAEIKEGFLQDEAIRVEYENLRPKYELVAQIIDARKARGLLSYPKRTTKQRM